MRLLYKTLARYAELTHDNTFTIVSGGFHRILASEFPVVVPSLAIVLNFEAPVEEHGDHRLEVDLLDPAQSPVTGARSELKFSIDEDPDHREFTCLFQLNNLEFKKPGLHRFRIKLDGSQDVCSLPLSMEIQRQEQ